MSVIEAPEIGGITAPRSSRRRSGLMATIQTLLANTLILAINMATGLITARCLGPAGRGEQAAMVMWPQFLAYTMTLGLPAALLYNLKRYPEDSCRLFAAALLLGTALSMAAGLTGVVFIPIWLSRYSRSVIHFAQWAMLATPMSLVGAIFIAALQAREEFGTFNQARYLPPLLTLTALGALVLAHALTPFTSTLAILLPSVPISFWLLVRLWRIYQPRWHGLREACWRLTHYGLGAYGIDLLGTLAGQVDQVLVVGLLTPAHMGLYVVALSLSRMLNVCQTAVVMVLLPKTAGRPAREVTALVGRAMRVSTAITLIAALTLMALAPLALRCFYGTQYLGAMAVFRILALEAVLGGATWVSAQAFMALGRPGTVTILQGIGLALCIPLMLLLIPRYGMVGAGLALLASTSARLLFILSSYPLLLKVRPPSLLVSFADFRWLRHTLRAQ